MRCVVTVALLVVAAATQDLFSQAPAQPTSGPVYEVVSIRRNTTGAIGAAETWRPDGGFTMPNSSIGLLIARAFAPVAPIDMVGLPSWASSERYDISATSSLSRATAEERIAMLRAMLTDRFQFAAHIETREQPVYDLVLARADGRLGPGLTLVDASMDCEARAAAERAAADAALAAGKPAPPRTFPDLSGPPPPCTMFTRGGQMDAHLEMKGLAFFLRSPAGRPVIDKTGLKGMYRVQMEFDRMAGIRGPAPVDTPGSAPSVFTAVQERLGLKLESSTAERDILVIDRLERPTEN